MAGAIRHWRGRARLAALAVTVVAFAACSGSTTVSVAPSTTPGTSPTTSAPQVPPGGCTPARPAPQPKDTFVFGGREYSMVVPSRYDGVTRTPLMLVFHAWASDRREVEAETHLDVEGAKRGYIVATPQAQGDPAAWDFAGGDFAYVNGLVADIEERLCVNAGRIFAAGYSAGSAFVGVLICQPPYRFAAAVMVAAMVPSTCPDGVTPAILGIHGKADPVALYDGGVGAGQTVPIPPVLETVEKHALRSGCALAPRFEAPEPGVERLSYVWCRDRSDVALITILDGGHEWPGGEKATADENAPVGASFSATNATLEFFDARVQRTR